MSGLPNLQTTITARDETAAVFERIARSTEALAHRMGVLSAAGSKAATAAPWLQMHGSITRVGGAVSMLEGRIAGLHSRLTTMLPMLGGLGAGASAGGLFVFAENMAKAGIEAEETAKRLGLNVGELSKFSYIARMTNTPMEAFTASMAKFNDVIFKSSAGKGPAVPIFKALGINLHDAHGQLRSTADLIGDVFKAYQANPNSVAREGMARAFFGRGGGELTKMFGSNPEELARWAQAWERMKAPAITEAQRKAQKEYFESWQNIGFAVSQVETRIGRELAPALTPMLQSMERFLTGNQGAIAAVTGRNVTALAELFKKVDWLETGHAVARLTENIGGLVDRLGGLGRILEAYAIYKFGRGIWFAAAGAEALALKLGLVRGGGAAAAAAGGAVSAAEGAGAGAGGAVVARPLARLALGAIRWSPEIATFLEVMKPSPAGPRGEGELLRQEIDHLYRQQMQPRDTPSTWMQRTLPRITLSQSDIPPALPSGMPSPQMPLALGAVPGGAAGRLYSDAAAAPTFVTVNLQVDGVSTPGITTKGTMRGQDRYFDYRVNLGNLTGPGSSGPAMPHYHNGE